MENSYGVCRLLARVAGTIFITFSIAAAEQVVVIPLLSASGDAMPSHVVKNQTFSSEKGKGLIGTLAVSPSMQTYTTPTYGMTFNFLPVGTFTMGSPADEPGRENDEIQHQVTLTGSFYMQTTEVTQQQWKEVVLDAVAAGYLADGVLDEQPSTSAGAVYNPEYPVETVTWNNVNTWITALNQLTGRSYALPTEAQWEYAARATTTTAWANAYGYDDSDAGKVTDQTFNSNLAAMGWYVWQNGISGGYESGSKPVAKKQSNAWGLYDMHGNVAEWCFDWYGAYPTGSVSDPQGAENASGTRVYRGGGYSDNAKLTRSAARFNSAPETSTAVLGFRLTLYPGE